MSLVMLFSLQNFCSCKMLARTKSVPEKGGGILSRSSFRVKARKLCVPFSPLMERHEMYSLISFAGSDFLLSGCDRPCLPSLLKTCVLTVYLSSPKAVLHFVKFTLYKIIYLMYNVMYITSVTNPPFRKFLILYPHTGIVSLRLFKYTTFGKFVNTRLFSLLVHQ